ncbi:MULTISPECIES: nSTAND1 domain-containing NTPase [Calothrix]|uniref:Caspase family protein n=2 Tax=Calothrix TaxID=1186 RepID=A0ABR8A3T7_9CYAN|nr:MULTISPECIES: caspase family protein [Calothrix]MBD2194627.1 caspase family protein [Calothrix parietina FACHB-288]MBD2223267.1 caspase family protein [Calothrix anomala FACHB-343]
MSEFSRNLAFIIGINNYANGISPLQNAVNDARKIVEILREKHEYKVWVCLDEVATLKNLNQLLEKILPEQVSENDRLLFYFAGHGIALNGDDGPTGYLIPQDAKLNATETYLPMTKLQESLEKLPCRHFLGILDCCFAGAFRWSSTRDLLTTPEVIHKERYDRFITDPAWQVITSAAYDQKALDAFVLKSERGQIGNHSPFAAALIEALAGKADIYPPSTNGKPAGDGVITATELYLYLRDAVEPATEGNHQRQTPGIWPLKKHDKGEYIFLTPGHELNLPPAPPLDANNNPYRGLESYEEEHSKLFFGRSKLVEKLHEFVKTNPLTVVLGASGSGKSSLVKAGLIPQLRQDNTQKWEILEPIRPGETPLQALSNALRNAQLPEIPAQNPEQKLAMSIDAWAKNHPKSKLLLFIDQSEEIITLCQNEDERKEFFQQILTAINVHRQRLRVVLSLRSDFEPQIRDAGLKFVPSSLNLENTVLRNNWYSGRFIVPAMTRGELREAIEKPAEARVMYFQPHELVEQLIDEVADMPGALPLLSFALRELYLRYLKRQRDAENRGITIDRALTQADYQDLGGVIQSLTQKADAEYEALVQENSTYEHIIRQVMLRMVALGGGELARRRVPLSELEYPPPKHDLVKEVIEHFTKARLLVTGEDAEGNYYVEPAHDALVRGWQKLLGWKQEDEQILVLQRELTQAVQKWANFKNQDKEQQQGILGKTAPVLVALDRILLPIENFVNKIPEKLAEKLRRAENQQGQRRNKSTEFLWDTDPYLEVLDEKLKSDENWFNQLETEFVQKSLLQKRQNSSWRWRIAIAVMLGLSGLTIAALIGQRNAQIAQIQATITSSEGRFAAQQELDALLDSLRATKQLQTLLLGSHDSQMKAQLAQVLQQAVYGVRESNRLVGNGKPLDWGVDGQISWSPDGQTLAFASGDNTVQLWRQDGSKPKILKGYSTKVLGVSWSSDGKILATVSKVGEVKLWKPNGELFKAFKIEGSSHCYQPYSVNWSPNAELLALPCLNDMIQLWKPDGTLFATLKDSNLHQGVFSVSWNPDGNTLASGGADGKVRLWKPDGTLIKTSNNYGYWVIGVSWNPHGQILATTGGNMVKLLQPDLTELTSVEAKGHGLISWNRDGQILAAAGSNDGTVKLWKWDGNKRLSPLTTFHTSTPIASIKWSPDGETLATLSSSDGTVRLWKKNNPLLITLNNHSQEVNDASFSPNGELLATASGDRTVNLLQRDGTLLKTLTVESGVNSVSWSPDGQTLASAEFNTVKLWHPDGTLLKTLPGHSNNVYSVRWNPDGQVLASAAGDGTVKLWQRDGTLLQNLIQIADGDWGYDVSWSSDGKLLAAAYRNGKVFLLQRDGKQIAKFDNTFNNRVSWSPNGKILATSGGLGSNNVELWQPNGNLMKSIQVGSDGVDKIAWRPNGRMFATTSRNSIKLWKLDGTLLTTLKNHTDQVNSVAWSPDGKILVSASKDQTVKLWQLHENLDNRLLDDLQVQACHWMGDYLQNNPNVNESDRHLCDNVPKLVDK